MQIRYEKSSKKDMETPFLNKNDLSFKIKVDQKNIEPTFGDKVSTFNDQLSKQSDLDGI